MPFSESSSSAGSATSTPCGAMPTTVAVAPARSTSQASRIVTGEPTASKAWSTPPGTSSSTASAPPSTASVAPRASASARFAGSRSTATIRPAPASRAAATSCRPTPPQPTTQTLSPTATRAALRTAPTAVTTPQPSSDACQSGSAAGIGTAHAAGTTARSAKQATKLKCCAGRPSASRSRLVPSSSIPAHARSPATSQRLRRPAAQAAAAPAGGDEAERDVVAGRDVVDALPHGLDDAGALVPEHHRHAAGAEVAVGEVEVGVAHAGGGDAHEQLAGARRLELDLLDGERRVVGVQDGGADPHATRCASSASRSGDDAEPGPVRRPDRPVGRDRRHVAAEQPVAPRGRPAGRVERDLEERAGGDGEREVQVGEQPEPVGPRVRRPHPPAEVRERGDPPAAADPAREHHVGLDDVDAAAQDQVARLGQAPDHLARGEPQRGRRPQPRVALDVADRQRLLEPVHAERLERPRRTAIAAGTSHGRARSPGIRQPWLASTMISIEPPTASRTASTTATSSRQSAWWKRSFTARTPAARSARTRRARSSGATSSPLDA